MSRPLNISGAPASSAGDEFHETWALLRALELLERDTQLEELSVEGVRDAANTDDASPWDGVDCALYLRPRAGADIGRIELVQLKYSVTGAGKKWTPSRFLASDSRVGNNSVARRLADAFKAQCGKRHLSDIRQNITVTLLSNQPISVKLKSLISDGCANGLDETRYAELKAATGLSKRLLPAFCHCLRLKGGAEASADLRSDLTLEVWNLLQAPASDMISNLQMRIRERMLPQGIRRIDRATVLSWFSIGDDKGLFPCEPRLEPLGETIDRMVMTKLAVAVQTHQLVCLHGSGGCGKTTAARSLEDRLPDGSKVIIYDCFGGGRYKDRSEPRHRPLEAFKQLANELARVTGTPLFFPYGMREDMAAAFRSKLDRSAALLARSRPGALLTLLIDAADNAIHAAGLPAAPETCFVHELISFQDLPANVRIVISSRSSRLETLRLPHTAESVLCPPFAPEETATYLTVHGLSGTPDEIEDFHKLTNGNPRVQSNAIERADSLEQALEFLKPNGQSLDDLFDASLTLARQRSGVETPAERICAALAAVPTPAPLDYLSSICDLPPEVIGDLVTDLAPNLRLSPAGVEIANEDFEDYFERAGTDDLPSVTALLADVLYADRLVSEYAAIHLFDVLLAAGRKSEMQACLEEESSTECIDDPVKRRQVELARLRAALHVASQGGSSLNIARTILIGAESVRTSSKVETVLKSNPDLSAAFVPDSVIPLVLNDPDERPHQGGLLLHLASEYVQQGERFAARTTLRAADEWIQEHFHSGEDERRWPLDERDILAQAYTIWKHDGWDRVSASVRCWLPISFQLQLFKRLFAEIAIREGVGPLGEIAETVNGPELSFVLNALERAGSTPRPELFRRALDALAELEPEHLGEERDHHRQTIHQDLLDELIFLCEAAATREGLGMRAAYAALTLLPDKENTLEGVHRSTPYKIDLTFRVALLKARTAGEPAALDKVFEPPEEPKDQDRTSKAWHDFNFASGQYRTVCDLLPIYDALDLAWTRPDSEGSKSAISALLELKKRSGRSFEYDAASRVLARRLLDLYAIRNQDPRETLAIISPLFGTGMDLPDAPSSWMNDLLHNHNSHVPVLNYIETCLDQVRNADALATEKSESLIRAARLALPWNRPLADAVYKEALDIVEELDLETIDVLHALCRIVGNDRTKDPERAARTAKFAGLMHHAGRLLRNEDGFPQKQTVKALCRASFPVACAAVAQWTDEGFGAMDTDFAELLRNAAAAGQLRPHQAALLGWLIGSGGSHEAAILAVGAEANDADKSRLADILAVNRLVYEAPGPTQAEIEAWTNFIRNIPTKPASLGDLESIRNFRAEHAAEIDPVPKTADRVVSSTTIKSVRLAGWQEVDLFNPDGILAGRKMQPPDGYADPADYFSVLRDRVTPGQRSDHLTALAGAARTAIYPLYEIRALTDALDAWRDSATRAWSRTTLPKLIPQLSHWTLGQYWTDPDAALEPLLRAADCNPNKSREVLVQIIEQNALDLSSRGLLMLLAAFVSYMEPEEAGEFADWCIARTFDRLPDSETVKHRYNIDLAMLPVEADDIFAALVYRFLGDIDAQLRWRATHVLREAPRLGETELLGNVLTTALSGLGPYTFPDCPFHYLSADLHIAIAFAQLAFCSPAYTAAHELQLMALWEKRSPHFLIGHFLARALQQAGEAGETITTPPKVLSQMAGISGPVSRGGIDVRKTTALKEKLQRFDQYGERFKFNSMDTIPSWYNPSLAIFEGAPSEVFIRAAELHIVDEWGGHEESHHWVNEPRKRRLNSDYYDYSNRHGSHPRLERHALYLEWHGMFAAVGDLLKTYPLRPWTDEDTYERFPDWLRRHDTTYAGAWLSDLRRSPPLDVRYWRPPDSSAESWPDSAASYDPIPELTAETGWIVLAGHRSITTYKYGDLEASEWVRVDSAFIAPESAAALLRSLADTSDKHDIYLPKREHQDRMGELPDLFQLIDSHRHPMAHRGEGLDEHDPFRFNASGVCLAPSQELAEVLALSSAREWDNQWVTACAGKPAMLYNTWSSERPSSTQRERRYGEQVEGYGDRLTIDPAELESAMKTIGRDLIMIVSISRTSGDDYARNTQKGRKESSGSFPILLRRDGSIWSVSGSLGTWSQDRR